MADKKPMPGETSISGASAVVVALTIAAALLAPLAQADAPSYAGASADAKTVFFTTTDSLVPGDTDLKEDVYQRSFEQGLGIYVTREISTGPTGGNDAYDASFRGASKDGETVFFSTNESLLGADKDPARDIYARLGSGATVLVSQPDASCVAGNCGNENTPASFLGASDDGSRAFFATSERLSPLDTDASFDIYARTLGSPAVTVLVSRAATGCVGQCGTAELPSLFEGASVNGDRVTFSTSEVLAPGDSDQLQDIYQRDLGGETALVSTSGICPGVLKCDASFRGASSSGGRVFFQTSERIGSGDGDAASDVYAWSGAEADLVSRGDSSCALTNCGDGEQPTTYVGSSLDGSRVFLATSEPLTLADADVATDIYARDLAAVSTTLVSEPGNCVGGLDCNAVYQGASADGNLVFFQTGERAAAADTDTATDVFVRDIGLGSTALVSAAGDCPGGCANGPVEARFAGSGSDGSIAYFTTAEALSQADSDDSVDVYARDVTAPSPATTLVSPSGTCPLNEEKGCHVSFEVAAADGSTAVFSTTERLAPAEDNDSVSDIYSRTGEETRLVSTGNSVQIGPATPILTGTNPASPNPALEPGLLGHADSGTAIKVYASSDCSGAPIATGTVGSLEGAGIPVKVASGSTTILRATASDASGESSGCSATAVTYTQADPGNGEGPGGGGASEGGGAGGGSVPPTAPGPVSGASTTPTASKPARTNVASRHEVPQTHITFAPASKTSSRRPVFRFTDATEQEGTTFQCRVDRRPWSGCSSPMRLKRLAPGAHAFKVKGSNSGLTEPLPVVRKFKVVGG